MLKSLLDTLGIPIMFLNFGAGIIGGIWLAFLGQWKLLGIGIFLLLTSHWTLSLLMLPGIPLGMIAARFYEKKNPFGHFFGFLSQLYTNILIVGTCLVALAICSYFPREEGVLGYLPFLLWSWGMALGPWQFFASKEPDNVFSGITLFSASLFYLLLLAASLISPILAFIIVVIFGITQLLVLPIVNLKIARNMET